MSSTKPEFSCWKIQSPCRAGNFSCFVGGARRPSGHARELGAHFSQVAGAATAAAAASLASLQPFFFLLARVFPCHLEAFQACSACESRRSACEQPARSHCTGSAVPSTEHSRRMMVTPVDAVGACEHKWLPLSARKLSAQAALCKCPRGLIFFRVLFLASVPETGAISFSSTTRAARSGFLSLLSTIFD